MHDIFIGILLGIVEGLTEFAPVSSTGHMILVADLLGIQGTQRIDVFEVVVQLGAILAVARIFWERITSLLFTSKFNILKKGFHNHFNWLHILIGMIPAVIVGGLFYSTIKAKLFTLNGVLLALILGGILLIVADLFKPSRPTANELDDITYTQAFIVGVFQIFALWPGFSRSGSTIAGGVLCGMNYKIAAEYTFLLALPMMFAASVKDLYGSWGHLGAGDLPLFIAGLVAAYLSSVVVIKFFLRLVQKIKLTPFAVYRFVVATLFFFFLMK